MKYIILYFFKPYIYKIFYYKNENYLKKCPYILYIMNQSFYFNYAINPLTKRRVRVGGATFKKLTYVLNPNNGNRIKINGLHIKNCISPIKYQNYR